MMTKNEFIKLVETYGASESRWPEELRGQMIAFRTGNAADAADILNSEAELDLALESARLKPGTDMLKARILSQLPSEDVNALPQPANSNFGSNTRSNTRNFGQKAVAALMLFAFTTGFAGASFLKLPGSDDGTLLVEAESEWEEIATDYGMDDIYEWVEAPAP